MGFFFLFFFSPSRSNALWTTLLIQSFGARHSCPPSEYLLPVMWIFFFLFCKSSLDFSIPELCLAPLFEFRGCSSTDCGLEWSGSEELSLCCPHPVFDPQVITAPSPSLLRPPLFAPDRSACGGNREGSCWGSRTAGGMTATAGGVAVLRTCEPWMSLFHMALACRVTRNAVMKAVIAHTLLLTTHPHPSSSPERDGRGYYEVYFATWQRPF